MKKADTKLKKKLIITFLIVVFISGFLGVIFSNSIKSPRVPRSTEKTIELSLKQKEQISHLELVVTVDPDDTKAWIKLGNIYFDTNNYLRAIKAYSKSLELSPDDPNVLTDLGVMYRRNGQSKKAIQMFEKAAAIDSRHEQSRFNKGVVLLTDFRDKDGAVAALEELLIINPAAISPSGQSISGIIADIKEGKR